MVWRLELHGRSKKSHLTRIALKIKCWWLFQQKGLFFSTISYGKLHCRIYPAIEACKQFYWKNDIFRDFRNFRWPEKLKMNTFCTILWKFRRIKPFWNFVQRIFSFWRSKLAFGGSVEHLNMNNKHLSFTQLSGSILKSRFDVCRRVTYHIGPAVMGKTIEMMFSSSAH